MAGNGGEQPKPVAAQQAHLQGEQRHDQEIATADRRARLLAYACSGAGLLPICALLVGLLPDKYKLWISVPASVLVVTGFRLEAQRLFPDYKTLIVRSFWIGLIGVPVAIFAIVAFLKQNIGPAALVALGRKDGKVADLVPSSGGSDAAVIIYFHNSGPGVARRFNAAFLGPKNGFVHMTRTKNLKDGSISIGGRLEGVIGPDADYQVSLFLPADQAKRMLEGSKLWQDHTFNGGVFEYCARNGLYKCGTFGLWFDGPPLNRFTAIPSLFSICPAFSALPTPSADTQSLPPCDGLDEQ